LKEIVKKKVIKKIYLRLRAIKREREGQITDFFRRIKDHILFDELRVRFDKNPRLYTINEPSKFFFFFWIMIILFIEYKFTIFFLLFYQ
jgi:hypothetical protein